MRYAPGYRHNDITGLIIGKPNNLLDMKTEENVVRTDAKPKRRQNAAQISGI